MRVLLVEDEPAAARVVAKGLREHAYAVDVVTDGEAALAQVDAVDYDAIVLDLMIPLVDGLSVCRAIRQGGRRVPILILTARDGVDARVEGLDAGADDYLIKPFDFRELLARVRALVRRGQQPILPHRITVGPLDVDTRSRQALIHGRSVPLTTKEYALLEYLVRRHGEVVSRAEIAEHVWDEHYDAFSNEILWFLHHGLFDLPRQPRFDRGAYDAWDAYVTVNAVFADAVAELAAEGDTVLVQDYQLALVGGMLRARRPDLRIAAFTHIPFCGPNSIRVLPEAMATTLLGSMRRTPVGFHTERWARAYRASAAEVLGGEPDAPTFASAAGSSPHGAGTPSTAATLAASRSELPHLHRRRRSGAELGGRSSADRG